MQQIIWNCKTSKLTTLNLSRNMIEDLPSQLFSLHNLEKLNLFGNRLSGILSSEFSKLKKVLQICSLRNNMMYKTQLG